MSNIIITGSTTKCTKLIETNTPPIKIIGKMKK